MLCVLGLNLSAHTFGAKAVRLHRLCAEFVLKRHIIKRRFRSQLWAPAAAAARMAAIASYARLIGMSIA